MRAATAASPRCRISTRSPRAHRRLHPRCRCGAQGRPPTADPARVEHARINTASAIPPEPPAPARTAIPPARSISASQSGHPRRSRRLRPLLDGQVPPPAPSPASTHHPPTADQPPDRRQPPCHHLPRSTRAPSPAQARPREAIHQSPEHQSKTPSSTPCPDPSPDGPRPGSTLSPPTSSREPARRPQARRLLLRPRPSTGSCR
jgi:hypothetical protein